MMSLRAGAPGSPLLAPPLRQAAVLLAGLAVAVLVRVALLPAPGLAADLDSFARWAHEIATGAFGHAYDHGVVAPAVMPYVWGLTGLLEPAFRTATDASGIPVRIALKLPAVVADIALAFGVGYHLREHPRWAFGATLALLLHPAFIDISAWWGQFDSLYVLGALAAYLLAVAGRPSLAAVALALALMTKPQAGPLLIPFAAWWLARMGLRGSVRPALAGLATIVVLWLPFIAADGPQRYLQNLATHQDGPFGVLSLRAWNPWWLLQSLAAGGEFVLDSVRIAGPISFRAASLVVAGLLELAVFAAVWRRPTPTMLAWGVAASALAAVTSLTTMHERYAFPAIVFLALAFPDRRAVVLWLALSVTFTLNVLAAVPPTPEVAALLPVNGVPGIVGSLAKTAITTGCLLVLVRPGRRAAAGTPDQARPSSARPTTAESAA